MTTFNYTTTTDDCYGGVSGSAFYNALNTIAIGDIGATGSNAKAWIPFVVNLKQGRVLVSATLRVVASVNKSDTTCKVLVGCEDADNPAAPTSWAELDARGLTTAYLTDNNVAAWTAGTEYTFDITTAVQEVLDRAGWAAGNTLAVLIHDNGSTDDINRQFASSENATYAEAILTVVTRSGGQVI